MSLTTVGLGSRPITRSNAARMCVPQIEGVHGDVFILAGDTPLVRGEVLRTLHQAHADEHAAASMATAVLEDPTGYGRIIRRPQLTRVD